MKRYQVVVIIGALLPAMVWAQAAEKKVTMKDLPAAVQRTVREQTRGATLVALSKEIEKGKTIYEAEAKVNGRGKDISIDSTGAVVEVEEEVALESIPPAAKAAIEIAAGKGKILKVESVAKPGLATIYEARIQKGGKKAEVRVTPDGSPVGEE